MTFQPCPICGTVMLPIGNADETGEGQLWRCPECEQNWTDEQIDYQYFLMEIDPSEDYDGSL